MIILISVLAITVIGCLVAGAAYLLLARVAPCRLTPELRELMRIFAEGVTAFSAGLVNLSDRVDDAVDLLKSS